MGGTLRGKLGYSCRELSRIPHTRTLADEIPIDRSPSAADVRRGVEVVRAAGRGASTWG
jgi:hypothetical protein